MVQPHDPASGARQTVADIMFDPEPVVEQSAHLAAAAYMMRHAGRSELVVVDDGASRTPVGIITAFDVVRAVSHASNPSEATVAQWESPKPKFVHPETPLLDAFALMLDESQLHVPVVDGDGKLVGVIDLVRMAHAIRPVLEGPGTSRL
jgi:CBS domain-containing protein